MPSGAKAAESSVGLETAARHASPRVPITTPDVTVGEARSALIGQDFETVSHVVVQEEGIVVGILRMEALLAAPEQTPIAHLMDRNAPMVAPGVDQEVAAWEAIRHREAALTVVGENGALVGVIPPHRLLAIVMLEHEEDLSRLGGFLRSTSSARETSLEPVRRRFWHRLPWLLIGLAGALLAAGVVGSFEAQLEATVMLAFFIPSIVYLADAVGTQTETVVVRGLSVGVRLRSMLRREVLAGAVIGVVLALVAYPFIVWGWHDPSVALVVSLALFAACSTATLVAMLLPWVLTLFGRDPAFGSGPLATVIQDLLSILIYLAIATVILQ